MVDLSWVWWIWFPSFWKPTGQYRGGSPLSVWQITKQHLCQSSSGWRQDFSLMMGAPINDEGKRIYGDAWHHLHHIATSCDLFSQSLLMALPQHSSSQKFVWFCLFCSSSFQRILALRTSWVMARECWNVRCYQIWWIPWWSRWFLLAAWLGGPNPTRR